MPSIFETLRSRMSHQSAGGLLAGLGGSGGLLSTHIGVLQSRLATAQAATGGPLAKVQAVMGNASTGLGAHLRAGGGGGLLGSLMPASTAPATATDATYQVSSSARVYSSPTRPPGIEYH